MGKFLEGMKRFGKALGEGIVEGSKIAHELEHPEEKLGLKTEVTLNAEALQNLKGMSCWQLEKIFKNKVVHLADDPSVYRELKCFNTWQLEAIFGKEENQ